MRVPVALIGCLLAQLVDAAQLGDDILRADHLDALTLLSRAAPHKSAPQEHLNVARKKKAPQEKAPQEKADQQAALAKTRHAGHVRSARHAVKGKSPTSHHAEKSHHNVAHEKKTSVDIEAGDNPDMEEHVLQDEHNHDLLPEFWEKAASKKKDEKPTIVFADSGIGGLSIMSTFIEKFEKKPIFASARLIFYDMAGLDKRGFLRKVEEIWKMLPDILLIACNGMSAMYMETQYSQMARFPVLSMLPFGRDMWSKAVKEHDDSIIITFVSETTNRKYVPLLEGKGVALGQIQVQTCQDLINAFNGGNGPDSPAVDGAVKQCVSTAWGRMTPKQQQGTILMGMGCTHFGWAQKQWRAHMENQGKAKYGDDWSGSVQIKNPNDDMAAYLFDQFGDKETPKPDPRGIDVAVHLGSHFKESDFESVKKLVASPLAAAIDAAKGGN